MSRRVRLEDLSTRNNAKQRKTTCGYARGVDRVNTAFGLLDSAIPMPLCRLSGMPLNNGEVFAGYVIQRLLGTGGMGEVYLAQHPRLPVKTR